jgi:DNA-binding NarL/FixJ family response regulator
MGATQFVTRTRVFIISAQTIHRDGLRALLKAEARVRIVGAAGDCIEAAVKAPLCRPDVVLFDLAATTLPQDDVIERLSRACTPAQIILFAPALDRSLIPESLRRGVRGVIAEDVNASTLLKGIQAVASGRYWLPHDGIADLIEAFTQRAAPAAAPGRRHNDALTARELEIVSIVAAGDGNRAIAKACGISEKTVKHHLTNIFGKLGVHTRLELAVFALEHRLVQQERKVQT